MKQGTFVWAVAEMVKNPDVGYTYNDSDAVFYFRMNRDGVFQFISECDDDIEVAVFDAEDVKCENWHCVNIAPRVGTIEWVKGLPDRTKVARYTGTLHWVKEHDGMRVIGAPDGRVHKFDEFCVDGWGLYEEPKPAPVVGSYAWAREQLVAGKQVVHKHTGCIHKDFRTDGGECAQFVMPDGGTGESWWPGYDDGSVDRGWTLHEPELGSYAWAREHHTLEQRVAALEARMG